MSDAREYADMPRSKFVSDPQLINRVNKSIKRLYRKLVAARGQEYYRKSFPTFNTVSGQNLYPLPSDFFQLISVEITDGTFRRCMQPFMEKEHARWREYSVPGGYPIDIAYVPAPTTLVNPDDAFDGICGFEDWVALDVAIGMLAKEESDTSELKEQRMLIEQEIDELIPERDAGWPERIVDVSRQQGPYVFSGGIPRYRLRGATDISGAGQSIEILWGPIPGDWFGTF
jgi:hypothetical protein